jgi:hypothetical protein
MGYLHVEVTAFQSAKRKNLVCGDFYLVNRDEFSTTIILCDGLGSGIKANLAATMAANRLNELLNNGFSLRNAFVSLVKTMEEARKCDLPYAVFSVAKILNDGVTSILSYEMPPPIFLSGRFSNILQQRIFTIDNSIIGESNCYIKANEAVLMLTDGITQAGLGKGIDRGWGIDNVNNYVNSLLLQGYLFKDLPEKIESKANELWKFTPEDDCSVIVAKGRVGKIINIFTGPPKSKELDEEVVNKFMNLEGLKIVCGATTGKIVARVLCKKLEVEENFTSNIAPLNYYIEDLDLVTEGAVTLNQVYNIWDADPSTFEKNSPVTDLYSLLSVADKVHFICGVVENPANEDISFQQHGILKRKKIVPLLINKLKEDGKLVTIEYV